MGKAVIHEAEKSESVVLIIREAMEKIDRSCQKAYVLQELFAGLNAEDGSSGEKHVDNELLLNMGIETILGEIVTDNEEASDYLTHLTFKKALREVTA